MSEQLTPDDAIRSAGGTDDQLALYECTELQTLLDAARLVEAEAEEQQWTRTDPVEVPGLQRAARLLRTSAALHVETSHRAPGACASA